MDTRKLLALWLLLGGAAGCLESVGEGIDDNVAPTADAGDDRTVAFEGREVTVTLDGSASRDIDGKIVRYIWRSGGPVARPGVPEGDVFDGGTGDGGAFNGGFDGGSRAEAGVDGGSSDEAGVIEAGVDSEGGIDGGAPGEGAPDAGGAPGEGAPDAGAPDAGAPDAGGAPVTPDPEDVVKPKVTLTEGVHVFVLWVTDDDGATSPPDTVVITVGGSGAGSDAG